MLYSLTNTLIKVILGFDLPNSYFAYVVRFILTVSATCCCVNPDLMRAFLSCCANALSRLPYVLYSYHFSYYQCEFLSYVAIERAMINIIKYAINHGQDTSFIPLLVPAFLGLFNQYTCTSYGGSSSNHNRIL